MTARDIKEVIDYWWDGAREDLKTAKILFKNRRYDFSLFLCHLALEKGLKALVVEKTGGHAPYTHNLTFLAAKLGVEFSEDFLGMLDEFKKYNLEGRYPDIDRPSKNTLKEVRCRISQTKDALKKLENLSKK